MATYYRKANRIMLNDKKTILHDCEYINEAKRESCKLTKGGDTVIVIRRTGGRK